MTITTQIYDTDTLLRVMRETAPVRNYWLDLCFPEEVLFDTEYIDFEKVSNVRKIAPLVTPLSKGVPIYSEESEVIRITPAYVKAKDPVTPGRMIRRRPGGIVTREDQTPIARWRASVGDIAATHRQAIERRWEVLAARAIIDGSVTLVDDNYPERIVNFQRDSGNTKTLTSTAKWSSSESDPIGDINSWRRQMRLAKFGGGSNRITMGADAYDSFIAHSAVRAQLDTTKRGTSADVNTGIKEGLDAEYMGTLGAGLEVWVYQDYYVDPKSGSQVKILDKDTVVLTGDVRGVRAFGAILDTSAQLRAMSIHSKMWNEEDPSVTFIMSQSAPLMVPVNVNATLKVKVQ